MTKKIFRVSSILFFLTLVALANGCGSSSDTAAVTAAVVSPNTCTAGYVYTQYGCLTQGGCQAGYALYNNQCIPATTSIGAGTTTSCQGTCQVGFVQTANGCLPVSSNCGPCTGFSNGFCYYGINY